MIIHPSKSLLANGSYNANQMDLWPTLCSGIGLSGEKQVKPRGWSDSDSCRKSIGERARRGGGLRRSSAKQVLSLMEAEGSFFFMNS